MTIKILTALLLAIVVLSALFGDEPNWRDPFPRMPTSSATLQQIIDSSGPVCDLGWQVYSVDQIILTPAHDGKTIKNFYFRCNSLPQNKVASLAFCRKLKWFGVQYPDGPTNFTIDWGVWDGGFPTDFGYQPYNEMIADQQGRSTNAMSTITYGIDSLTLRHQRFENFGNSGFTINAKHLVAEDCYFYQVAKHCIGIRGRSAGGNLTEIRNCVAVNCGNALDFHDDVQDRVGREPHVATVENYRVINPRGRSKLNDSNLDLTIVNWDASQDSAANLCDWPALDVVMRPRALHINGFRSSNFWAHGLRFGQDTTDASGVNEITDGSIANSLNAMTIQQPVSVKMMVYAKCNFEYRVMAPSAQDSNVTAQVGSDLYWAQTLDACQRKMLAFNAEHGTNYALNFWVPNDVYALMEVK